MVRPKTHFEQVPREIVEKIVNDQIKKEQITEWLRKSTDQKMCEVAIGNLAKPTSTGELDARLILCRVHLEEVESELNALSSTIVENDSGGLGIALDFVQQARKALAGTTDTESGISN
jgi:hypothetical protein